MILLISSFVWMMSFDATGQTLDGTSGKKINQSTESLLIQKHLKEVFGEYYKVYGEARLDLFTDFYNRCEFIPLNEAPKHPVNISNLRIKHKYNSALKQHETEMKKLDVAAFNVFKYQIDYYKEQDQYFRIYKTNTVLKVKASKN